MRAIELATKNVVTIAANAPIATAAKLMREKHVGDVVVVKTVDGVKVPIGVLTDRDLVVGVLAQDITDFSAIKVHDVMGDEIVTVGAHEDVLEIVRTMLARGIRRIPIVDGLGELVGIVAYDDVVHLLSSQVNALSRIAGVQADHERWMRR